MIGPRSNMIVLRDQPCASPECGSSDAMQIYGDGHAHCFSCGSHFMQLNNKLFKAAVPAGDERFVRKQSRRADARPLADKLANLPIKGFTDRGISQKVNELYGVRCKLTNDSISDHFYPYGQGENASLSYKHRVVATKEFTWIGPSGGLFGRYLFTGVGKRIVITEGEIDALSVAQMWYDLYQRVYPVVGLSSSTAVKQLIPERAWLRGFDVVILCFDMDEAGREAVQKAARIIGWDKVRVCKLPHKDANEVLTKCGYKELQRFVLDSERIIPPNIVVRDALWDKMKASANKASVPYPDCIGGLNHKLIGMRGGEITLVTSGTGACKSTVMREIILHLLKVTEDNIGVAFLEELSEDTGRLLSRTYLNKNNPEIELDDDDLRKGFDGVFGSERVMVFGGEITEESIYDSMEFMALSGCKYIILDHITLLVAEGAGNGDENAVTDRVMGTLLKFVKNHAVWVGLVSHLRKTPNTLKSFEEGRMPGLDDIRGSGSVKQISFDIIAFARNMTAADVHERNTVRMRVLKCRHTGRTGDAGYAIFDESTGRLNKLDNPDEAFDLSLATEEVKGADF